jgi:hypothetical protein
MQAGVARLFVRPRSRRLLGGLLGIEPLAAADSGPANVVAMSDKRSSRSKKSQDFRIHPTVRQI